MSRIVQPLPFGPLLGQIRRHHELSQDELANQLGCRRTYISQLERNLKIPSNTHLNHLIETLRLAPNEANELIEAASISRGTLEIPEGMPLEVKRQLVRLIQKHKDLTSLRSWSALVRELAELSPVSR